MSTESDSAKQPHLCPECATPIPPDAPKSLCPFCLLRLAAEGDSAETSDSEPESVIAQGIDNSGTSPLHLGIPRAFADYRIEREIARGGMGVVYLATQLSLGRRVAVKMVLYSHLATEQQMQRFRTEAMAAARLHHPNIVSIHEIGEAQGQPYFTMDYVEGVDLEKLLECGPFPPERAASHLRAVAHAIHYAHLNKIIHRDLKPSNILIDAADEPHITDFGLAAHLEMDTGLTVTGQPLGSPRYMPPEQVSTRRGAIGPWSDVYALGAILYHALTGRPPFAGESAEQVYWEILNSEPVPPRKLQPSIPRDLEIICLRCLQKAPAKRYATALDVAEELERWLNSEPIRARPTPALERLVMWAQRNPAVAGLTAGVIGLFVLGFCGVVWYWQKAEAERARVRIVNLELKEALTRVHAQQAEQLLAQAAREPHSFTSTGHFEGLATLVQMLRHDTANRVLSQRLVSALTYGNFALPVTAWHVKGYDVFGRFSPDGSKVLIFSDDGLARLFNSSTGEPVTAPMQHPQAVSLAQFTDDGGRLFTVTSEAEGRLWDAATAEPVTPPISLGSIEDIDLSGDGQLLVARPSRGTNAPLWELPSGRLKGYLSGHGQDVLSALFAPESIRVLTVSRDGTARVWDAGSLAELGRFEHPAPLLAACWSRDGRLIGTACEDGIARVWEADTGRLISQSGKHPERLVQIAISPDHSLFATAAGRNVRIWNLESGHLHTVVLEHWEGADHLAFSPDSRRLLTSGPERAARVWDVTRGALAIQPLEHDVMITSAEFNRDGTRIVTAGGDGRIVVWDCRDGAAQPRVFPGNGRRRGACLSMDGRELFTAAEDAVQHAEWASGSIPPPRLLHQGRVRCVRISPDGSKLVTGSDDKTAKLWDAATKELLRVWTHSEAVEIAEFSPDGKQVVTATSGGQLHVWDVSSATPLPFRATFPSPITSVALSPDGSGLIVAGAADYRMKQYDVKTGDLRCEPMQHGGPVYFAEFSPDGKLILTACLDGAAIAWDASTGTIVRRFPHDGGVYFACFSPDGTKILTCSQDGTARVWETSSGRPLIPPVHHGYLVLFGRFDSDGGRFATASRDRTARVWDTASGLPLSEPLRHAGGVQSVQFSSDGTALVTTGMDLLTRVWRIDEPALPLPAWLLDLAECIAGRRINEDGSYERIPAEKVLDIRPTVLKLRGTDNLAEWGKWFFGERTVRPPAPGPLR